MSLPTHFTLSNGLKLPSIGLGTWQSQPGEVRAAVAHALKSGYRHIDCAHAYGNETEVGQGIKDSGVPRKDIWVTSKLFETHHRPEYVRPALKNTLNELGLEYLDLYLMHWPLAFEPEVPADGSLPSRNGVKDASGKTKTDVAMSSNHQATWREMEKLVDEGLVKSIGVSNFNIRRLRELLSYARIKPVTDQVELSMTCPQPELVAWLQKNHIVPQAYSPLGGAGAKGTALEIVEKLSKKHDCTPANVILSWLVGRGCNPLPKSVTDSRITSNQKLVNLSKEDVDALTKYSTENPVVRVCDQTEDVTPRFDIFEENHPEHNDKAQALL